MELLPTCCSRHTKCFETPLDAILYYTPVSYSADLLPDALMMSWSKFQDFTSLYSYKQFCCKEYQKAKLDQGKHGPCTEAAF